MNLKTKWITSPITKSLDPKTNDFVIKGYFTSDEIDAVGDIITKEATLNAVAEYKKFPTLRMQHDPSKPIGRITGISSIDGLEWNELTAIVVDDNAKKLIANDVLSAFSVGVQVHAAEPIKHKDGRSGLRLTSISLVEISAVDSPACKSATITERPFEYSQHATFFKMMPIEEKGNLDALVPNDITEPKTEDNPSEIQSLVLSKEKFNKEEATEWVKSHDFKVKDGAPDETEDSWRYRQFDPSECDEGTYGTQELTDGVKAVYCVKKQKGLDTPTVENTGREIVDEEKTKAPETPVETPVETTKAMDEGAVMDAMSELKEMMKQVLECVQRLEQVEEEYSKPVEETKTEPEPEVKKDEPVTEVKTETPEVNKAQSEVDLVKSLSDVIVKSLDDFLAKAKENDEAVKKEILEYIEKLRTTPQETKAAMKPPEEYETVTDEKLVKGTEQDRRNYLRGAIAKAFTKKEN